MNERIQELAYEAEDYADSIVDQGGEFHPAYTKKFAELIVRQCLFIIDDERKSDMVNRTELWKQIKQHFGVEE